jgi:N-methylhydantoinase A
MGGTELTVTDCTLLLGWLGTDGLAGGTVALDAEAAREAVETKLARPLGLATEVAAFGAVEIATASMIRAIRAVSSERGRDPRDFALVAFGGNGGIFGPLVAADLGIRRVIIPPAPGLFSAAGLLDGVVEHRATRTHKVLLTEADPQAIGRMLADLAASARSVIARSGHQGDAVELRALAGLRYHGQSFELTVPIPHGVVCANALADLAEAFGAEHERTYGHRAGDDEPVELVSLSVVGRARGAAPVQAWLTDGVDRTTNGARRRAYFGPREGWRDVPVMSRAALPEQPTPGPMIVPEYDATIVVPPRVAAHRDRESNVIVDL